MPECPCERSRSWYATHAATVLGAKCHLYTLRSAFEDSSIKIPFDDDRLISSIRKIRKTSTAPREHPLRSWGR